MKNKNKILVAATVGATIGGILGILFAPDKGKNTRKKIKETSSKFSDSIKDKVNGNKI